MSSWILSSSVLICIMMLLRFMFRGKISLRLQYALWLLVAVRLLIPINFGNTFLSLENYTQPMRSQPIEVQNKLEAVQTTPVIDESEKIKVYEEVHPQKNDQEAAATEPGKKLLSNIIFDAATIKILQTVWILGILVIGIAFAASNLVFSYRIRKTRKKLRVPYATIPVYVSNSIDTPCLYHLFHPTIYLTKNLEDDEKLLFHAVSHEMTHFFHKDLWWNVVRCICIMIHWYNPLVWWAAVVSKRDCELACDEATIQRLGEKERLDYGKTLIKLTCRKQKDFFVVSTSMTAGRKSIKERIRLIARKPKTTLIGCIFLILVLVIATGCTFTRGVKNEPDKEAVENPDVQTEPAMDDIDQSDTKITPTFYEEPDKDSVCLAVMPDGISKAGGDYRYLIPENQIYWVSEYKEMRSLSGGDGAWNEDEESMGIWLVFHDEWTHVTDQGFIVNFDARVNKEDALDFYQLCMEEANKNGVGNPIRPEEITELSSATLNYNETYEVTDAEVLVELQKYLSSSKELRGGAGCPFTASMDLKLKNGKNLTIYLATDSCSVWISDGVYYQVYGYTDFTDIDALYDLFKEKGIQLIDTSNAEKIITMADSTLRDGYEDAVLTYVDNSEVGWNYYSDNPWVSKSQRDELAQAAIKELYTLTGFQIEECVYTTDGRSKFIFGKSKENIRKSIAFYSRDFGYTLYGDSTPYMGFVNARRVHYSDVQQLDSPYNKAQYSGHAAIPTWFLEHSGIYQGQKITGYEAFNLNDTVYTHVKLFFDGGYYVVVMDEAIESVSEVMGPYYDEMNESQSYTSGKTKENN